MKVTTWIIIALLLAIPLGAFPLMLVARIFSFLAIVLEWIARGIDFFGWGGILGAKSIGYGLTIFTELGGVI